MSFKSFDWYGGSLGFLFSFFLFVLPVVFLGSGITWLLGCEGLEFGGMFKFDLVSAYFCFLSSLVLVSLIFTSWRMSTLCVCMLLLSLCSSFLCYCCVNGLWFWGFYEMSILPLLLLLVLESPYSERFVAVWYLVGYVVFTSLPMLLCIFYLSGVYGGLNLGNWSLDLSLDGPKVVVIIVLAVLFITKIPLPPFHVWLPIVHAEASSPVSICLSGYIMKLGLLGVLRFGYVLLSDMIFSDWYVLAGLCVTCLFFFSGCRELDGKRWLAFMSLSHIVISAVCLNVCGYDRAPLCYAYCLGHGVSAALVFLFLWLVYEIYGTRNWVLLGHVFSSSLLFRFLGVCCVCSVASIPPMVTFFTEVYVMSDAGSFRSLAVLLLSLYLFLGGLVPLFVIGGLVTRHYSISYGSEFISSFLGGVFFLILWVFTLFLVV